MNYLLKITVLLSMVVMVFVGCGKSGGHPFTITPNKDFQNPPTSEDTPSSGYRPDSLNYDYFLRLGAELSAAKKEEGDDSKIEADQEVLTSAIEFGATLEKTFDIDFPQDSGALIRLFKSFYNNDGSLVTSANYKNAQADFAHVINRGGR